jgi:hypothetical protein
MIFEKMHISHLCRLKVLPKNERFRGSKGSSGVSNLDRSIRSMHIPAKPAMVALAWGEAKRPPG